METTKKYFKKYGSRTLVISRFLPVVRTFAPILAGVTRMNLPGFSTFNILGAMVWIGSLGSAGYYFGSHFPGIIHYVEYIIFFFLAITTAVVIRGYFTAKKEGLDN